MAQLQLVKAAHQHPQERDVWTKLGQLLVTNAHAQGAAYQAELCAKSSAVLIPYPLSRKSEGDMAASWLLARTKVSITSYLLPHFPSLPLKYSDSTLPLDVYFFY